MQNIWGKEMRAMKDDRFLKFTLSLSRMNKKVQAVKTAGMGMVGLKAAHTAVLYALSGHSEGLQFAEVAAACDLDPALISRTFSELIAAGMVEKQGEPGRYRLLCSDRAGQLADRQNPSGHRAGTGKCGQKYRAGGFADVLPGAGTAAE